MGQQQLLLLVLGIVIVGLAVVVGIQAFGENQKKANQDAMVNDGIRIASDAQAWALKPAAFGGGEGSFTNMSYAKLGYDTASGAPTVYSNVNGNYTLAITAGTPGSALISAAGANDATSTVSIRVCGLESTNIKTAIGEAAAAC